MEKKHFWAAEDLVHYFSWGREGRGLKPEIIKQKAKLTKQRNVMACGRAGLQCKIPPPRSAIWSIFFFSCVPNHRKVQESACRELQARKSNDLKQFTCWNWEDIVSVRSLRQSKAEEKQQVRSPDKRAEDQHAGSALADPSSEAQGCFGALSLPSLPLCLACSLPLPSLWDACVCLCVYVSLSLSLPPPSPCL